MPVHKRRERQLAGVHQAAAAAVLAECVHVCGRLQADGSGVPFTAAEHGFHATNTFVQVASYQEAQQNCDAPRLRRCLQEPRQWSNRCLCRLLQRQRQLCAGHGRQRKVFSERPPRLHLLPRRARLRQRGRRLHGRESRGNRQGRVRRGRRVHGHLRLQRRRWRLAVVPVVDGRGRHPARRRQAQAATFCATGVRSGDYCCSEGCNQCGGSGCGQAGLLCCGGQINALSYPDKECILANDDACRIQSGLYHGVAGRRLSEDMAERRYNSVSIDCPCERGRCSHFRGTFAGTGAAVHPALTFSVRPKGEDAPWTEVGTVASVADSVPFDLELPLWATGVQLQLFQEERFAVSIHAACVGCEFTCEPEWGECLTTTSSASCATSRARARSWAAARSTSPSSALAAAAAVARGAAVGADVRARLAARRALHRGARGRKPRRRLPREQLRGAGGSLRQPRVPFDHHRCNRRWQQRAPSRRCASTAKSRGASRRGGPSTAATRRR